MSLIVADNGHKISVKHTHKTVTRWMVVRLLNFLINLQKTSYKAKTDQHFNTP